MALATGWGDGAPGCAAVTVALATSLPAPTACVFAPTSPFAVAAFAALLCGSFDDSSGLFSCGFTVERTTMNLFRMSNQNGAPSVAAFAVMIQPMIGAKM